MAHPKGESGSDAVRLDFDRRLMLQFRGSVVTSDAELLAYRELDDALGLTEMAGDVLADPRSGKNGRHALAGPTKFCRAGSAICSRAQSDDLRTLCAGSMPISAIGRTWTKPRRVIAKVEWHPGELYPRVGFIVTNMSRPAERVVAFYNKRGTCEHDGDLGHLEDDVAAVAHHLHADLDQLVLQGRQRSPPTRCGSSFMRSLRP